MSEQSRSRDVPFEERREIVAVLLTFGDRVGLFRRSAMVGSDAGLWHCITGFVEVGETPLASALREVQEESGVVDLVVVEGPEMVLVDESQNEWLVHTFLGTASSEQIELNWEHDDYQWIDAPQLAALEGCVAWLPEVVRVLLTDRTT